MRTEGLEPSLFGFGAQRLTILAMPSKEISQMGLEPTTFGFVIQCAFPLRHWDLFAFIDYWFIYYYYY